MLIKYTLPLSHIAPQSSFHQKRKLWPFQLWAMQAHHHGLVLGLFCPRMSSEITVEVILCKYSRQSVKPEIPVCIAVAIPLVKFKAPRGAASEISWRCAQNRKHSFECVVYINRYP